MVQNSHPKLDPLLRSLVCCSAGLTSTANNRHASLRIGWFAWHRPPLQACLPPKRLFLFLPEYLFLLHDCVVWEDFLGSLLGWSFFFRCFDSVISAFSCRLVSGSSDLRFGRFGVA